MGISPKVTQFIFGYKSSDGKVAIPAQFEMVQEFVGDYAHAYQNEKWGIIHPDGLWAVKPQYEFLGKTENGFHYFRSGKLWGIIDSSGKEILPAEYTDIISVSERAATVKDKDKILIINFKKEVLLDNIDEAGKWNFGLSPVLMKTGCGVLTEEGKWLIEPKKEMIYEYSEGLAAFDENGKSGYLDQKGNVAIEPTFDAAFDFSEGLARVRVDEKFGYINKSGEFIIPAQWDDPLEILFGGYKLEMTSFKNGIALVARSKVPGYINTHGEFKKEAPIITPKLKSFREETKEWRAYQEKLDLKTDYDKKFNAFRVKLETARTKDEVSVTKVIKEILSMKFPSDMHHLRLVVNDLEDFLLNLYPTDAEGNMLFDQVKSYESMKTLAKVTQAGVMDEPKTTNGQEKLNTFLNDCARENLKWFGKLWKENGGEKFKHSAYIQNDDDQELFDLKKQIIISEDDLPS